MIYDYKCPKCDKVGEHITPLNPTIAQTPQCCGLVMVRQLSAPNIVRSAGNFHSKVPDGFKSVLQGIHERAGPLSRIDTNKGEI